MGRIVILFLALASLLAEGCRQHDYRVATVLVPEMQNEACAKRIAAALRELPGIDPRDVKCDMQKHTLIVRYDSMAIARKNIEHMIAGAGFRANDIKPGIEAVKALPDECR